MQWISNYQKAYMKTKKQKNPADDQAHQTDEISKSEVWAFVLKFQRRQSCIPLVRITATTTHQMNELPG